MVILKPSAGLALGSAPASEEVSLADSLVVSLGVVGVGVDCGVATAVGCPLSSAVSKTRTQGVWKTMRRTPTSKRGEIACHHRRTRRG